MLFIVYVFNFILFQATGFWLWINILMWNNEGKTFQCLSLLTLFYFKLQIMIMFYLFSINVLFLE